MRYFLRLTSIVFLYILMFPVGVLADAQIRKAGVQAYIYGLPIVLMDRTSQVLTRTSDINSEGRLMNQLMHAPELRDHRFKAVVRPNNDTLPSSAFLNLKQEPMVLSVPEVKNRYFSFAFLDAWTNSFTSRGTKSISGKKGVKYPVHYFITGPEWKGEVPTGMEHISSPTNLVWLLGRTEVRDEEDLKNAIAYQKQYQLMPFSKFGTGFKPVFLARSTTYKALGVTPKEQVEEMTADVFFSTLMRMMKDNPPPAADLEALSAMKAIGLDYEEGFDFSKLPAEVQKGLSEALPLARKTLIEYRKRISSKAQWSPDPTKVPLGDYGTRYVVRAIVANVGFGALKNEEAVYQGARTDSNGEMLTGQKRYVIRFKKGMTPPVNAFWSISLYDKDGYYVDNEIKRYKVGSNNSLKYNDDGSLNIYIQHTRPEGEKARNWLPSPKTVFNLNLRMYWPKAEILEGQWKAPAVSALD